MTVLIAAADLVLCSWRAKVLCNSMCCVLLRVLCVYVSATHRRRRQALSLAAEKEEQDTLGPVMLSGPSRASTTGAPVSSYTGPGSSGGEAVRVEPGSAFSHSSMVTACECCSAVAVASATLVRMCCHMSQQCAAKAGNPGSCCQGQATAMPASKHVQICL